MEQHTSGMVAAVASGGGAAVEYGTKMQKITLSRRVSASI